MKSSIVTGRAHGWSRIDFDMDEPPAEYAREVALLDACDGRRIQGVGCRVNVYPSADTSVNGDTYLYVYHIY